MGGRARRVENVTFSLRRRLSLPTFFRRRKKVGYTTQNLIQRQNQRDAANSHLHHGSPLMKSPPL